MFKTMSEAQDPDAPEQVRRPVFDLNDATVDNFYANTTSIVVGQSDVSILFGFQPIEDLDHPAISVKRVILTHDSFIRMMEYWAARYTFLQTVYEDHSKSLRDLDQNKVNAAFVEMLGTSKQKEKEGSQNGTSSDGNASTPE